MTPWSTEVALQDDGTVRVTAMLSLDPGPARAFRPFIGIELEEGHAYELFGKLAIALEQLRDRRHAIVVEHNVVAFRKDHDR